MNKIDLSDQLRNLFESLDVGAEAKDLTVTYDNEFYTRDYKQQLGSPKASFSDDPLALSCASYRIYKEQAARRFTNIDLVKATQEDRTHAQAIRDYYNQRYTMRVLKGGQLTEYQQKAAQFLSGLHHLTTEELGLLYKLPYFYEEDCALEQVVATTVSAEYQLPHLSQLTNYTLTPVVEILKSRKGGESVEFVYRNQHNHAVMIVIRAGDNMVHMLRGLFKQPSIQVQAHTAIVKLDTEQQHNVKKLTMWELIL